MSRAGGRTTADRGQLVLLAAALVAVALVPMAFAYLQLGSHPDVAASDPGDRPAEEAVRAVERAAANASGSVAGAYAWENRAAAAATFERAFDADAVQIERTRLRESVAVGIEANATAAATWADTACPVGGNRRFGSCEAVDGLVVQERSGTTAVVALAVDVTVTEPRGTTRLTVVRTAPFA